MKSLETVAVSIALLCGLLSARAELPSIVVDSISKAANKWELESVEGPEPKTSAGGPFKGYRVILTRSYDEDLAKNVTGAAKKRFNHLDLVLVPRAKAFDPEGAIYIIPWSNAPEEYASFVHWIGSGMGFEWFCRGDLATMDELRTALSLSGGDDRLQCLVEGLSVDDKGFRTADQAIGRLKAFGKAAIPAINSSVAKTVADGKAPVSQMLAFKALACDEGNNALSTYFAAGDSRLSSAAGNALLNPPYVSQAKDAYLKMLSDGIAVPNCVEACKQFGWKAEALPLLENVMDSPRTLKDFEIALLAYRGFKEGSIDMTALNATSQIYAAAISSGDLPGTPKTFLFGESADSTKERVAEAARKRMKPFEEQIAKAPDKDIAFLAALWLCLFQMPDSSKAFIDRIHSSGLRVLRSLPRQKAEPMLLRLSRKLKDKDEAAAVLKVMRLYQAGAGDELPAPQAKAPAPIVIKNIPKPQDDGAKPEKPVAPATPKP